MTPMFTLLLGCAVFVAASIAGLVTWGGPFAAGALAVLCFLLFLVVWAFDGAGKKVQDLFGDQP